MVSDNAERSCSFVPLTDIESLSELIGRSKASPVILFKHSLTCSISSAAYQEMQRFSGDVALLIIQQSRDVSMEVERLTGVRHESPQVIVMRNSEAVWNASHWNVTAEAVESAVRDAE